MHDVVASPPFARWMAAQRWYPGESARPRPVARFSLPVGSGDVEAAVAIVADDATGLVFQIPLARRAAVAGGNAAIVEHDGCVVVDGTRDPDCAAALYRLATSGGHLEGDGISVTGVPFAGSGGTVRASRVLTGEQSNTSIIVEAERPDGTPVATIVKVFRMVHDGDNPDVILQSAIAGAGSSRVPASFGAIVAEWGETRGHLAFAQEFLPDTRDAWRVALDAAASGRDFREGARSLGEATSEVHAVLATALPTAPPGIEQVQAMVESFRSRALAAYVAAPDLEPLAPAVDALYERASREPWPPLQRIHGDYHLGQVLDVPGRGWVLLDFEGEPLRPMTERSEPDLALRDVAGMLRSFDYVAGSVSLDRPEAADAARSWADSARRGFLEGYESGGGDPIDLHPTLLTALELDKALYEVIYEARNRPSWLPIPRAAVERLVRSRLDSLDG